MNVGSGGLGCREEGKRGRRQQGMKGKIGEDRPGQSYSDKIHRGECAAVTGIYSREVKPDKYMHQNTAALGCLDERKKIMKEDR